MPDWKAEILERLSNSRLPPTREAEIVEELAQHLDDRYQRSLQGGANPDEAYQVALLELAETDLAQEMRRVHQAIHHEPLAIGEQRSTNIVSDLGQDLRYGLRMLLRNPGFTLVAVIALALGIGANSAIFSVVNTVLLRPLPFKDADRLVMVWEDASKHGFPRDTPAAANYIDWRNQNQVFEGMAAIVDQSFNLTNAGEPERIEGRRISANLFSLLGVEPAMGRSFTPEEDQPGTNRVVILSHGLWQRRFGSDGTIVGKAITLNGVAHTVVGVMPGWFEFPSKEDQLWVPIAFSPQQAASRGNHYLQVVARLKPGVGVAQAQAEMNTIAARLQQQYPEHNTDLGAVVVPLHEQVVGDIKPALMILLGAVGLVLLISCANVANLLLARAAVRQKEIALRVALGASRGRLIRQFLTESILLSALGGILGLLLSFAGLQLMTGFIPNEISQLKAISLDVRVLGFTIVVALLTGLIFGLVPALQASIFNPNETLKEGGRDSSSGSRGNGIRGLLVIAEVAVSLVLLIGAGLLINSFLRLRNLDPGFRSDNLLTMKVVLPQLKYPDMARRSGFYTDVLRRVEAVPGVKSAAVTTNLPLYKQGNSIGITIEGRPAPEPGKPIIIATRVISPNYFQTMGIPLLQGRPFGSPETAALPGAVVISESMARRYWPGEDPVGKRLCPGKPESPDDWFQIIGVVKDVRQFELTAEPKPQMYLSYNQVEFFEPRDLVISTNVAPLSLAATIRQTVWDVDKDQPVSNIRTMNEIASESVARQRFSMLLLGSFAGVALLLAAVGIYGVMSYSVTQRRNEIGIRMALGAQKRDVLKLTVGHGLKLVLIGVVFGLAGAFMLTRLMTSLLFGIGATDPGTFAAISVILVSVALLASYIPARRATKVDPLTALRYE
ncbi:MAG TPA: ABC transporter permease [Pyrinomonadaceae bacterium]|nr:ABC transporter permease [Pyrinomonadaceae bacterium]